MISQAAIKRSFKHIGMQIYLEINSCVESMGINGSGDARGSDSKGVVQQRVAPCYAKMDCTVNKIQFSSQVKGDAKENNPRDQVNIMTDNEVYVEKFKLLVDEMDVIRHPVNSLFAKSNNDIGLLTSGSPNYNVIEFDFPIKDGANLTPLPIKQHFLNQIWFQQRVKCCRLYAI